MKKSLHRVSLCALGVGFACFAGLTAMAALIKGSSFVGSRTFWATAAIAILLIAGGIKLRREAAMNLLLVIGTFAALEILLQIAAWSRVLPGINSKNKCA